MFDDVCKNVIPILKFDDTACVDILAVPTAEPMCGNIFSWGRKRTIHKNPQTAKNEKNRFFMKLHLRLKEMIVY